MGNQERVTRVSKIFAKEFKRVKLCYKDALFEEKEDEYCMAGFLSISPLATVTG